MAFRQAAAGEMVENKPKEKPRARAKPRQSLPAGMPKPPIAPPLPPRPPGLTDMAQMRQGMRQAEQQMRREMRHMRKEVRRQWHQTGDEADADSPSWGRIPEDRRTWHPGMTGMKWAVDIHGNPGFYTQAELDAMEASLPEEERIRRRIHKRLQARKDYWVHLSIYVMVNLMLWLIWFLVMPGQFMWPFIVTAGWGIGLVAHTIDYYMEYGGGHNKLDEMMQREVERELQRRYGDTHADKAKNESPLDEESVAAQRVRLSEDGEFTESFVEEQKPQDRRQNQ